jgi:site-specific recombinase XerD
MARRIDTVESRSKLPARRTPYWAKLSTGCSLGYRKLTSRSAGVWVARVYDRALKKDKWHHFGSFDELPAHQRFDAAKKAAEALAEHLGQGGTAESLTVEQACRAYADHLRAEGLAHAADDAVMRFRRWVDGDKLARIDVRKLAPHHLRAWRQSLIATPVIINPHAAEGERRTRKRAPSSVNRDMSALRAALNFAREQGAVLTDAAWRAALRPLPNADRRRTLYLDRQQRAALIEKASPDLALLLKGLALVPLRPGALAALAVAAFDKRLVTLTIGRDKAGGDRAITLPPATAAFFTERCRDKLPHAPLFARADGKPWGKDSWKKGVKAAAEAAELPLEVTAYTLRHSVITDLIGAGLDVLTVARLSGTSIAMIERHYGHLRAEHAAAALATLALEG